MKLAWSTKTYLWMSQVRNSALVTIYLTVLIYLSNMVAMECLMNFTSVSAAPFTRYKGLAIGVTLHQINMILMYHLWERLCFEEYENMSRSNTAKPIMIRGQSYVTKRVSRDDPVPRSAVARRRVVLRPNTYHSRDVWPVAEEDRKTIHWCSGA